MEAFFIFPHLHLATTLSLQWLTWTIFSASTKFFKRPSLLDDGEFCRMCLWLLNRLDNLMEQGTQTSYFPAGMPSQMWLMTSYDKMFMFFYRHGLNRHLSWEAELSEERHELTLPSTKKWWLTLWDGEHWGCHMFWFIFYYFWLARLL